MNVQNSPGRPSQGAEGRHRRDRDKAEQSKEGFLWEEVDQEGMKQWPCPAQGAGVPRQPRQTQCISGGVVCLQGGHRGWGGASANQQL